MPNAKKFEEYLEKGSGYRNNSVIVSTPPIGVWRWKLIYWV